MRYFAVQPFEQCTLEDLQSLVELLESFVTLSKQAEAKQTQVVQTGTRKPEIQETKQPHQGGDVRLVTNRDSIHRIAEVGVSLLTEKIRLRKLPRKKAWCK